MSRKLDGFLARDDNVAELCLHYERALRRIHA